MTVSVLASGQIGSDGTGNISGTHNPGGGITPDAVVVFICHNGSSSSQVSNVTYGGVGMTLGTGGSDSSGETLHTRMYYMDYNDGIPSGSQTVAVTVSGAATKRVYCVSLSTDADALLVDGSSTDSNDQADPSHTFTIAANRYSAGVACLTSGNTSANISVANGAQLAEADFSGASQAASLIWSNSTVNNGNLTMGWTVASDDVAATYIQFAELMAVSGNVKLDGSNIQNAIVNVYTETSSGGGLLNEFEGGIDTDASGNWSSYVFKGSNPYIFCSYESGGNKYTAPLQWSLDTVP